MPRPQIKRNRYSETFKRDVVAQYVKSGKAVHIFAREVGIEQSVVYRWIKRYEQNLHRSGCEAPVGACSVAEIEVIKKEIISLRYSVETLRGIIEKAFYDRYLPESFHEIGNPDCTIAAE